MKTKTLQNPILMAAYLEISGHADKTALKIFHEMQESILARRADAGAQVRRDIHDPEDRFIEYEKLDGSTDRDLFRAIWSCFPSVRKIFPSSSLSNNELGAFA